MTQDKEQEIPSELIKVTRCEEVEHGRFRLKPVKTSEKPPERPIPEFLVMSAENYHRALTKYFKYQELIQRVAASVQKKNTVFEDISWALDELEARQLRVLQAVSHGKLNILNKMGIGVEDLRDPEICKHPQVTEYMLALKAEGDYKANLDSLLFERVANASVMETTDKFAYSFFAMLTAERDDFGKVLNAYKVDDMFRLKYWMDQSDLINDVFAAILKFCLKELSIAQKKRGEIEEEASAVNDLLLADMEKEPSSLTTNDITSKKSSLSLESMMNDESLKLEKDEQ